MKYSQIIVNSRFSSDLLFGSVSSREPESTRDRIAEQASPEEALVFQQPRLVAPVENKLACDIGGDRAADFRWGGRKAQMPQP